MKKSRHSKSDELIDINIDIDMKIDILEQSVQIFSNIGELWLDSNFNAKFKGF